MGAHAHVPAEEPKNVDTRHLCSFMSTPSAFGETTPDLLHINMCKKYQISRTTLKQFCAKSSNVINYKLLLNPNPNLALANCLLDLLTANVTHFIGMLCIHLCMMYFECVLIKFLGYRSFFRALKIHHIISFYKQIFSGTQEARKNTKQKQNQTKEEKLKPLYH